jgi:Zn-finger nucleic acid-binding protein
MEPICPRCNVVMDHTSADADHVYMYCKKCEGSALTAAALCRLIQSRHVMQLLSAAKDSPAGKARCPRCENFMRLVNATCKSGTYELDVCAYCKVIWFDRDELNQAPTVPYMDTLPNAYDGYDLMEQRMQTAYGLRWYLTSGLLPGPVGDLQILLRIIHGVRR